MNRKSKAFAPSNISLIFSIVDDPDPRWKGSLGLGFTIDQGVTAEVSKSNITEILWNNEPIILPTVSSLITSLTCEPITVSLSSTLPLGSGFGLSGAAALSTAYAIHDVLDLNKSKQDLAILAHTAEVINKTGLGDVVNEYYGGMCLKVVSSAKFEVIQVPIEPTTVYCRSFRKLLTSSVLSNTDIQQRITNSAFPKLQTVARWIEGKKKITLSEILTLSKQFAIESGLLSNNDVPARHASTGVAGGRTTINGIEQNGGHATMIMLGNAVVSDIPFPGSVKLKIGHKFLLCISSSLMPK